MDALSAGHIQAAEILIKEHKVCFLSDVSLDSAFLVNVVGRARVWGWGGHHAPL